jgi:hypothetical protein
MMEYQDAQLRARVTKNSKYYNVLYIYTYMCDYRWKYIITII